jgi:ribosomal protein L7/L12
MTRDELIIECRRRSKAGEDIESIVGYLRASDCSKIDSIAVLNGACGIGLAEAKVFVHLSVTWADRRASDEKLHEDIGGALTSEKMRQ